MSYYSVYRQCIKFRETTLGVYVCFIEFYVFILDETYVVGPKLLCKHI